MTSDQPKSTDPLPSYLRAVASASLTWVVLMLGEDVVRYGFIRSVAEVAGMGLALFLTIGFFALLTAALPVFLVHQIAKRFSIRSAWYFVGCGALTGLALSPVPVLITPRMMFDVPPEPSLIEQSMNISRFMVPSGAVGGLVYWWHAIRPPGGVGRGRILLASLLAATMALCTAPRASAKTTYEAQILGLINSLLSVFVIGEFGGRTVANPHVGQPRVCGPGDYDDLREAAKDDARLIAFRQRCKLLEARIDNTHVHMVARLPPGHCGTIKAAFDRLLAEKVYAVPLASSRFDWLIIEYKGVRVENIGSVRESVRLAQLESVCEGDGSLRVSAPQKHRLAMKLREQRLRESRPVRTEQVCIKHHTCISLDRFDCKDKPGINVHRLCYHRATRYMIIWAGGRRRTLEHHCEIGPEVVEALLNARSVAWFYARNIKRGGFGGKYDCRHHPVPIL